MEIRHSVEEDLSQIMAIYEYARQFMKEQGIGTFCIEWAFQQCGHLRVDTHSDNLVMQDLLKKSGFIHCGTIYVAEDSYPRLAFEKI